MDRHWCTSSLTACFADWPVNRSRQAARGGSRSGEVPARPMAGGRALARHRHRTKAPARATQPDRQRPDLVQDHLHRLRGLDSQRMSGQGVATACQPMPFKYHRNAIHFSNRMSLLKGEYTLMQRAACAVAYDCHRHALNGVSLGQLAVDDAAAAAGGIAQTDRVLHFGVASMRGMNGLANPSLSSFWRLRAAAGGRII